MKKGIKSMSGILLCLIELAIGILLLVDPANLIATILLGLGILLILAGLVSAIRYFRTEPAVAAAGQGLMISFLTIGVGTLCVVKNTYLAGLDLLTTIFALAILVVGLGKVQNTIDRIRLKATWVVTAISAVLTVGFAVILLTGAFGISFWTFAGIALLVEAACDITDVIFAAVVKAKKENAEVNSTPAEVTEENN